LEAKLDANGITVRIGAYGLAMGLAPKPIGWAASRDYGR